MSTVGRPEAKGSGIDVEGAQLNRGLGVTGIMFMVVATAAPLGATVVVVPACFAASGNSVAPTYFVAAGAILSIFSVGFTLMGRYVQNAGAFYTYVQAGLGKITGAGAASLALLSYSAFLVGIYAYLGVVTVPMLQTYFHVLAPWWTLSFLFVAVVAVLGSRDIDTSAKVLGVFLVLELAAILAVNIAVVVRGGGSEGLSAAPLNPSHMLEGRPGLGLVFAFLAFIGFESTAVFRSEAKAPTRTIPRATYGAVLFIGLLHTFSAWIQSLGVGPSKIVSAATTDPINVFPGLAQHFIGPGMRGLINVLLVASTFAVVLSLHNIVTRYQFTLANAGLLPRGLAQVDAKNHSPSRSSYLVSALTIGALGLLTAAGFDPVLQIYTWLVGSATLGIILLMALTSLSVMVFHRRNDADDPMWNATVAPVLSLLGLSAVLYLVISNFHLLIGGLVASNIVFAMICGCFLLGVAVALVKKIYRPQDFDRLLE